MVQFKAINGYLPSEGQKMERASFSEIYGNSNWGTGVSEGSPNRSTKRYEILGGERADYLEGFALQRPYVYST